MYQVLLVKDSLDNTSETRWGNGSHKAVDDAEKQANVERKGIAAWRALVAVIARDRV